MVNLYSAHRLFVQGILSLWNGQKDVRTASAKQWQSGEAVLVVVTWI